VENGYPRFGSNLLQVPDERFWELKGGGTGAILKDFIDSFNRMCEHFYRDFGKKFLCSGIRDFKTQIAVRKRSVNRGGCPSMTVSGCSTAVPGSSNHGWGQAVDIKSVTRRTKLTWKDPEFKWLQTHAGTYGWIHPSWAQKGGSMPEPWHWEPANKVITLIK
jgi:LAS superfamily LD-carboxypeptidase LdcB